MAVTRREFIFCAFLLSVLSVLLIVVAVASDSWVVSTAYSPADPEDSTIQYGLFRGELVLNNLATPTSNTLRMTCIASINACALSCKTELDARRAEPNSGFTAEQTRQSRIMERILTNFKSGKTPQKPRTYGTKVSQVEALANGYRPSTTCASVTDVDTTNPMETPPVISFGFYVALLLILFVQLTFAVASAGLAIINATKNPTEPIFGLPGCLWVNCITALLGLVSMLMFGIYWRTSGLKDHLAFSYIALGFYTPGPALGYSYWILIASLACNIINVGLITIRSYLLERDPPPPTIEVQNHSDGTIFLY